MRDKRLKAIKAAAKRHGLHAVITDEPLAGLAIGPGSRVVYEASGVVHNCHVRLQYRRLNAHLEDRSASVIQLDNPLQANFLISDNERLLDHTRRTSHSRTHKNKLTRHTLLYRDTHNEADFGRLDKIAALLPDKWSCQSSGDRLYLFRMPAAEHDEDIEEVLRSCAHIRELFVAA